MRELFSFFKSLLLSFCLFVPFFLQSRCLDEVLKIPLPEIHKVDLYSPLPKIEGIIDSVVAAIVVDGKMLLLQRGGGIGRGEWGLVGGKLDPGESIAEALLREVKEEVGLCGLDHFKLINTHYHLVHEKDKAFRVFVVRAELMTDEVPEIREPDKILDMGWFGAENLPSPIFANFSFYQDLLK